jgi:hypothetical protein
VVCVCVFVCLENDQSVVHPMYDESLELVSVNRCSRFKLNLILARIFVIPISQIIRRLNR